MDPITDMFNRIRNAQAVAKKTCEIPFSNLKLRLVELLKENNLIDDFKKRGRKPHQIIRVDLAYKDKVPKMEGFKRISKPGQRIYKKAKEIRKVRDGYGIAIISTTHGVMTNNDARKKKVGGEIMVEIW